MNNENIKDLILRRKSTRAYSGKELSLDEFYKIREFLNSTEYQKGVFGEVRFELVANKDNSVFGAYGQITGATYYIAAIAKNTKESLVDVGYAFERQILLMEGLDMGTCWLAAPSYFGNTSELYTPVKGGETIVAISPIGEKANQQEKTDLQERADYNSNNRLPFDTLFFDMNAGDKVIDEKTKELLNLVRLAPSALNNQPWRVIMDGDIAHFYVVRRQNLHMNLDFQMMDVGAALYHYTAVSGNNNFFVKDPKYDIEFEYVISVT